MTDESWMTRKRKGGKTLVLVGGTAFNVPEKEPFAKTVKELAKKAGLSRFHVYVDDREILAPADAPEDFSVVAESVRISAYNKAG